MGKKKRNKTKSKCCNAPIKLGGGVGDFSDNDEICTLHAICTKCNKPCEIKSQIRKVWIRNPKTQIKGDERGKLTEKEIKKILQQEDF